MKVTLEQSDYYRWWCVDRIGVPYKPGDGMTVTLLKDDGTPAAVCLYTDFNSVNVFGSVAAEPGKHWLNRDFLWYCFRYPFIQMGVNRITSFVASTNEEAIRFDTHLGFTLEATLKGAHPDGDLLVMTMHKDQCRWLNHKGKKHE